MSEIKLTKGDKFFDGENVLNYWGKCTSETKNRYLVYVFFDKKGRCHELSKEEFLELERL